MSAIPPLWLEGLIGSLILALLVALVIRWVRLPYTIALVIVGLVLGWLGDSLISGLQPDGGLLSAELILFILLPPLLFEGASAMHIDKLKSNWRPISLLAIPGVLLNTAIIGVICWKLVWPDESLGLAYGLLIGSIMAATDPVSVLALVKNLGAPKRMAVLIEGESLFNDGTAIVVFNIILASTLILLAGGDLSTTGLLTEGIGSFLKVVSIGVIVGLVLGGGANWVMRQTEDHLVEISVTVALAFGTFMLAEIMHGSGVIAVVVAGLLVGNHGIHHGMTATARIGLHHFWEIVAFLINSILFLVIGYELQSVLISGSHVATLSAIAIGAALLARLVVFPLTTLSNMSRQQPISGSWQIAMYWGGLRGSIPIALLLILSHIVHDGVTLAGHAQPVFIPEDVYHAMVVMGFAVVFWTLIVQGLTMKPLLTKLGIVGVMADDERDYEVAVADVVGSKAALRRLSEMKHQGLISQSDHDILSEKFVSEQKNAESRILTLSESSRVHAGRIENARRELLLAQIDALRQEERRGTISAKIAHKALKRLDEALSQSEHSKEGIELSSIEEGDIETESLPEEAFEELLPIATEEVLGNSGLSMNSEE